MRTKLPLLLLVLPLVITAVYLPPPVQMQERNLGVGTSAQPGAGGYYALVIGNNAYTSLPRLKTAEADAREVAALLKDAYGFETNLLLNATRGKIVSALSSYRRSLGPDASLLIYYAGHGVNDADKAYWLPVDADRDDTANWIIADEITQTLKVIPAKHVLIVSDSCYSGTLTRGLGEALPRPTEREQFLKKMMAGKSRTLMASGGDEPVADGGGGDRHSVFANALLRGLREIDKGRFTAAELFRYFVEERVAGRAEQTPEYNPLRNSGHESGDFVFVKIKVDGKKVEVTVKAPLSPAPAFDPAAVELSFWESIKSSTNAEDFKDYLAQYPNGRFARLARRRMTALAPTAGKTELPARVTPNSGAAANKNAARPSSTKIIPKATVHPPVPASMLLSFDYLTVTMDANGDIKARNNKSAIYYAEDLGGGVGLEMVEVPGGAFVMGSPGSEARRDQNEGPQHRVTVPGFWMGKYEVTQAQYLAIMGVKPSRFKGGDLPVEQVSWNDAVEFCKRLSQKTGREYRLPSEAEWEYAARAGTTTAFAFGETLTPEIANYNGDYPYLYAPEGTSRGKTMAVGGGGVANGFGLYDMHGNVNEWCLDHSHENYVGLGSSAPTDGSAWVTGGNSIGRILRGGSWLDYAHELRSASRGSLGPDVRDNKIGFRVVAVART